MDLQSNRKITVKASLECSGVEQCESNKNYYIMELISALLFFIYLREAFRLLTMTLNNTLFYHFFPLFLLIERQLSQGRYCGITFYRPSGCLILCTYTVFLIHWIVFLCFHIAHWASLKNSFEFLSIKSTISMSLGLVTGQIIICLWCYNVSLTFHVPWSFVVLSLHFKYQKSLLVFTGFRRDMLPLALLGILRLS